MSETLMPLDISDRPLDISQIMKTEEIERLCVHSMTSEQQQALIEWGMKMYSLGQQIVQSIKLVKYDGRLLILEDDSTWEVDPGDIYATEDWQSRDKVLILNGTMYKLDDMEKVKVQEEII